MPFLFDCVKPSIMPTRTPAKWKSTKAFPEARNILPDEIGLFLQQDNVNDFKSMCTERCLSKKNTGAFPHLH